MTRLPNEEYLHVCSKYHRDTNLNRKPLIDLKVIYPYRNASTYEKMLEEGSKVRADELQQRFKDFCKLKDKLKKCEVSAISGLYIRDNILPDHFIKVQPTRKLTLLVK